MKATSASLPPACSPLMFRTPDMKGRMAPEAPGEHAQVPRLIPQRPAQEGSSISGVQQSRSHGDHPQQLYNSPLLCQPSISSSPSPALSAFFRSGGIPGGHMTASSHVTGTGHQPETGVLSPSSFPAFFPMPAPPGMLQHDGGGPLPTPLPHVNPAAAAAAAALCPYDTPYSYINGYGALDPRRKNATKESTNTLKAWLFEHKKNPYPTKGEKIMLAILTRMTLTQVSTWFANARRRLKKENKVTWSDARDDDEDDEDDDDDEQIERERGDDNQTNHLPLSQAESDVDERDFVDVEEAEDIKTREPLRAIPITPPPSPPEGAYSRLNSQRVTSPESNVRDAQSASSSSSSIPPACGANHDSNHHQMSPNHYQHGRDAGDERSPQQNANDSQGNKKNKIWSVSDMVNESSRTTKSASANSAASTPDAIPYDPATIFNRRSIPKSVPLTQVNSVFPNPGMIPVNHPNMRLPSAYVTNQPMFFLPGSSVPYPHLPSNHVASLSMRPEIGALKHS